ncbi:threonine ammonia-lyase [Gluconobacter japonicus]|uniref:Threonine ammonia-lyase n=1 Tax=Gluconobacter japonicus TaxID=376620 RepID=A0ABQ5WMW7_GLUJA|nr:threonine ammonia-lyase [Gluconobacter japonicus]KXV25827.1 threonine dehydratase [Gluconobacter japonicus]GBR19748.1 threonine dehydratase [Gluconobacter japonicus NBRC 3271]GLQ61064.1 threonine ammonia-lyase [Gluconobacter japonicus]
MSDVLTSTAPVVTIQDIESAHERIASTVVRTPTITCPALSRLTGAEITLKLENLQAIGSFKERGAANKMALLTAEERACGVITVSAGNHAQGVARQASLLGIDATIVMPRFTPASKIAATQAWGANVVLAGDDFAQACITAEELQKTEGRVLVHPFNDPAVIAGQGTAALELLQDAPQIDTVVVPVGGGGLIGGFATVMAALRPDVEVIGVQVEAYASLAAFPQEGGPTLGGSTIAEGIAVTTMGEHCLNAFRHRISRILVVNELQVESAITTLAEKAKQVCEGAGATGLAAVIANPELFKGRKVALPLSGGNINARILANTILRSLLRDGRILRLIFQIPDRPGMLADISARIGNYGGNIIEVSHHRLFASPSVQTAELVVMIEARDTEHAKQIETDLSRHYIVRRD